MGDRGYFVQGELSRGDRLRTILNVDDLRQES